MDIPAQRNVEQNVGLVGLISQIIPVGIQNSVLYTSSNSVLDCHSLYKRL